VTSCEYLAGCCFPRGVCEIASWLTGDVGAGIFMSDGRDGSGAVEAFEVRMTAAPTGARGIWPGRDDTKLSPSSFNTSIPLAIAEELPNFF